MSGEMSYYYAVRIGKIPGLYRTWKECETQVSGYSGATAASAVYVAEGTDYGQITETKPTTSGDCDTLIGYMVSATVAALEPGSRADSTVA